MNAHFSDYYLRLEREGAVRTLTHERYGFTLEIDESDLTYPSLRSLLTRWSDAGLIRLRADWSNGSTVHEYEFLLPKVKFIDVWGDRWWAYFTDGTRRAETHPLDPITERLFNGWLEDPPEGVTVEVHIFAPSGVRVTFQFRDRYIEGRPS